MPALFSPVNAVIVIYINIYIKNIYHIHIYISPPKRDHKLKMMLLYSYLRGSRDPTFPESPRPPACSVLSGLSPLPHGELVEVSTVSLFLPSGPQGWKEGGNNTINISRINEWFSTMWGELRFRRSWGLPPFLGKSSVFLKMRGKKKTV